MNVILKENERIDSTGFGELSVIQQVGLGYGVDAILLAAFAAGETGAKAIRPGSHVADLGSGSGIIGFVLIHKIGDVSVLGLDKRSDSIDRSVRAAELNGLSDRIRFEEAEIKSYESDERFDAVLSNPPYFRKSAAIPSSEAGKFIARHETSAELGDFIDTADRLLRKGASFYMVHRPDRLVDIFTELRARGFEPKELQLVVPHPGEAANIALIHAIKGAGAELKLLPEIAVHETGGGYTDTIQRIYER